MNPPPRSVRLSYAIVLTAMGVGGVLFAVNAGERGMNLPGLWNARPDGAISFVLAPGETRTFRSVDRRDEMTCHGETYGLWQGGYSLEVSTGVRVVTHEDGSVTAHCPRVLNPL